MYQQSFTDLDYRNNKVLHGKQEKVYEDSGYEDIGRREKHLERDIDLHIVRTLLVSQTNIRPMAKHVSEGCQRITYNCWDFSTCSKLRN